MPTNAALLLYHHPLRADAPTIKEHVASFSKYSRYNISPINVQRGFPSGLESVQWRCIILHYSLFGDLPFQLAGKFYSYVAQSRSAHKIAFFQDEYQFCPQRYQLIEDIGISSIFTVLTPTEWEKVYLSRCSAQDINYTLTGFVDDQMIALATRLFKPDVERRIDIGYRSRKLPFRMGMGGQEKTYISVEFEKRAAQSGLTLDLKPGADHRFSGSSWYHYLSECRGILGVEAGVSVFDFDDKVRLACQEALSKKPHLTFDEIERTILKPFEGNVHYRLISPRHFEAAAFKVCQILFEGNYDGIMEPMVHYIALKKDFSNFDEVMRIFNDDAARAIIVENAYRDLIASGSYNYRGFIRVFDEALRRAGLQVGNDAESMGRVRSALRKGRVIRMFRTFWFALIAARFPGRRSLGRFYKDKIFPYLCLIRGNVAGIRANDPS